MSAEVVVLLIGAAGAAAQAALLEVQWALERNEAPPEGTRHGRAEGSTPSGAEEKRG